MADSYGATWRAYVIDSLKDGFVVRRRPHPLDVPGQPDWLMDLIYDHWGGRRDPAIVVRQPCYLRLESEPDRPIGFFNHYELLNGVATCLTKGWRSPPETWHRDLEPNQDYSRGGWLRDWLVKQASRAIGKQVHARWQELLTQVDPTILGVHRLAFAANYGHELTTSVIMNPDLYRERHIVSDVLAFRAAQVAAGIVTTVQEMTNWRSLFCPPEVTPYKALNKTLTKLPGGVPHRLLLRLQSFMLPRPIFSRLELITTLCAANNINFNVFAHAAGDDIAEAMARVARFRHWQCSPRRWREVRRVVGFLQDFPERHNGGIVGLAEKAIRWHRDDQELEIQKSILELGQSTALAAPPIPLPNLPGVRFLGTVGDVCTEGQQMRHCIASYAKRAYYGLCYLFHVEFEGEAASVEVSPQGVVLQSQGPRDQPNKATAWGKKVLSQWGRMFPR